jgi:Pyruvate/2-oxoacid:ferredoxin oxidoreductase delta subunit
MSARISRRQWLSRFLPSAKQAAKGKKSAVPAEDVDLVAIIQGRYCLAGKTFCSVCYEQCPEPGAMEMSQGIPIVIPDKCTGCGICHDVCPAPTNAVMMITRR